MNDFGFYMYEGKGRKTEDILQVPNARHTLAVQKFYLFYTLVSPELGVCGSCTFNIKGYRLAFITAFRKHKHDIVMRLLEINIVII